MKITDREFVHGTAKIPLLYGLAYCIPDEFITVYYPIPINFMVPLIKRTQNWLHQLKTRFLWQFFGKDLRRIYREGKRRGAHFGYEKRQRELNRYYELYKKEFDKKYPPAEYPFVGRKNRLPGEKV